MTEFESCDVLCIGSGSGGLSAAITAGHFGADVLVVEAADRLGGAAAYSGGQIWVGNTDQAREAGIEDSEADLKSYLEWLSDGRADPSLRDVFVVRGPEAVRFLTERGVPLQVVHGMPDYYYPKAPGSKPEGRIHEIEPWEEQQLGGLIDLVATSPYGGGRISTQDRIETGGQAPNPEREARIKRHTERGERCAGAGLAAALAASAAKQGAQFHTATRAVRLIVDDARVIGAVVRTGGNVEREIHARDGVVLATGGYGWEPDMMHTLDRLDDVHSMAPLTERGDHFDFVEPLNGRCAVARQPYSSGILFGTHTPGEERAGLPLFRVFTQGLPHCIFVNAAGRRFADDSFHMAIVEGIAGGRDGGEPNWPAWVITDQTYHDKYPIGALEPGAPIPDGMAVAAQTVADLGRAAGIDPHGLEDEVLRFNAICEDSEDPDFGRGSLQYARALLGDARMPNPNLGPIQKAPFYAFPLSRVDVNCPAAGLVIGPDGEVHNESGEAIPGLYAAGNCVAQLDIGAGYNSGIGNQRGLLYGYLAARALTHDASRTP